MKKSTSAEGETSATLPRTASMPSTPPLSSVCTKVVTRLEICMSVFCMSWMSRFKICPRAVASKNCVVAWTTPRSTSRWMERDAAMPVSTAISDSPRYSSVAAAPMKAYSSIWLLSSPAQSPPPAAAQTSLESVQLAR